MNKIFRTKSPPQTQKMGADFAKALIKNPPNPLLIKGDKGGLIIGLTGDLGSGKTTFVQGMARGLGIDPKHYVNSPTFTFVNEYRGGEKDLIHVDLYRIEKPIEGETLGLEEYLEKDIVVIEWVEKIPELEKRLNSRVNFRMISDREREIEIYDP